MRSRSETPCSRSFAGIGRWPHSGIPGAPTGPALRSTITESASTSRSGSSTRAARSWMSSKTIARPSWASRRGSAAEIFITAPSGHRLPRSTTSEPPASSGFDARPDHALVDDLGRRRVEVLADRAAGDGERVEVQQVADLLEHRRQPAGVVEVLHQVGAGGLEVDEPRRRRAQLVEQRERQLDPEPPGVGDQVDDRVRRAGDRVQRADRVLERLAREDVRRAQVALDELDDLASGRLGEVRAARVDRRDRRAAGQRQPERLGHAGHRRRGPHRHAVAVGARHRVLDLGEVLLADAAARAAPRGSASSPSRSRAPCRASGR